MELIKAYYKFQLKTDEGKFRKRLDRIEKVGNHQTLNNMFDKHDKLWVHKVTPIEIEEYVGYVVGTPAGVVSWLPVVFETSTFHYPFGIMKSQEINDVVLFRIINEIIFEVFVLDVKREGSINYLQLMMDGYLQDEIFKIQSKAV